MAKSSIRATIIWLLAFTLMGSLFAAAAHDTHHEEHEALDCATCLLASHLEKGDMPPAIMSHYREPSTLEEAIVPAGRIVRFVLKIKARAPPFLSAA